MADQMSAPLSILLVEDDQGDAFLVRELLAEAQLDIDLVWVRTLAQARPALQKTTQCVLLDLALPDAQDLQAVHSVLSWMPNAAILVLTGFSDEHRGVQAVSAGAQDYLVKGQVDSELLARAIRFAIERKRAEDGLRRLREAELLAQENARLERGLLPTPILSDQRIRHSSRYHPGRRQTLLGGDFYDLVEGQDGTLFALIGDVSGHGPDEAALGVCLRAGWRTLVLAETPAERILPTLNLKINQHAYPRAVFATVCMVLISPDRRNLQQYLAGHPPAILLAKGHIGQLTGDLAGPALGIFSQAQWPAVEIPLPPQWTLLLYTDGLFEGKIGQGNRRLGEEGLVNLLRKNYFSFPLPVDFPARLINDVHRLNEGPLTDDVAVLALSTRESTRDNDR